jgi:hypothetical protein
MKMWWHYPNFVETDERTEVEFTSMEEFYTIPRIVELSQNEGFSRWSISDGYLMAEYTDESFWVIANRLDAAARNLLSEHLPKWVMPVRKEAELINRQLPARVVHSETSELGEYIVEARAVNDRLEYRYFGKDEWTPKPANSGLSYVRLGKLEQDAEDAAEKEARDKSLDAASKRLEEQRKLMKLSLSSRET